MQHANRKQAAFYESLSFLFFIFLILRSLSFFLSSIILIDGQFEWKEQERESEYVYVDIPISKLRTVVVLFSLRRSLSPSLFLLFWPISVYLCAHSDGWTVQTHAQFFPFRSFTRTNRCPAQVVREEGGGGANINIDDWTYLPCHRSRKNNRFDRGWFALAANIS